MRGPLAALALLLTLALAACATPAWVVHQRQGVAADRAALELAWSTPATQPDWLPADATRIRWVASTRGGADRAPAALEARTASPLPGSCERLEAPEGAAIRASWSPHPQPTTAMRCGNWAVTDVDGGYYAWTPVESATGTGAG